jgi:NADH pyrophosphatase NudC (nudix superfamily)
MTSHQFRFCPQCANPLEWLPALEDSGMRERLRCTACGYTHWNNPTPVLAAVIELEDRGGKLLLARNAAWQGRRFGLITGFMEAGETPQDGMRREIAEETSLQVSKLQIIGAYDFQRMNQVIIAYHAVAQGEIVLSPELAEYQLFAPTEVKCWPAGTGYALADWLTARGHPVNWFDWSRA